MKKRSNVWGAGLAFVGLLAACTPEVRELGDQPVAGESAVGGSSGAGHAGASTVVPHGGAGSPQGGGASGGRAGSGSLPQAGGAAGEGGAPPTPEECFAPNMNVKLALQEGALGCRCVGSGEVCVGDLQAEPPWIGMLRCEGGRWQSVAPSCDMDCFAPDHLPALAVSDPNAGCACNGDEPAECVLTEYRGQPWRVALYCEAGRWISAEDGVCGFGREADCRVDGVTYPHGGRGVPDPFGCGTCTCDDGSLTGCSDADCVPQACPDGSFPAKRCAECGPADGCDVYETGCFSGEGCETGSCVALCP